MSDFRDASDALRAFVLWDEIADALGASAENVRDMRRRNTSRKFVQAPQGWEAAMANLSEERAVALAALAARLRKPGK